MIHDFILLNVIRQTPEVQTAVRRASDGIRDALNTDRREE